MKLRRESTFLPWQRLLNQETLDNAVRSKRNTNIPEKVGGCQTKYVRDIQSSLRSRHQCHSEVSNNTGVHRYLEKSDAYHDSNGFEGITSHGCQVLNIICGDFEAFISDEEPVPKTNSLFEISVDTALD